MLYRTLFILYLFLYFIRYTFPGEEIFYAFSLVVGLCFIPYALKYKISIGLIGAITISYALVCFGSHDRDITSYISLYILAISNISIFFYLYFIIINKRFQDLKRIKDNVFLVGIVAFTLILIMELKVGGLVKVDHVNLFGKDINRNSIHPITFLFVFTYSLISMILMEKKSKSEHLFFLLAVVILFLSNSRIAQAASLIILVWYIFLYYPLKWKYLIFFSSIILLIVSLFFIDYSTLTERTNASSENSGLNSSRFVMWGCYYTKFEISQLLFGLHESGNDGCAYLPQLGSKNPHNSLIWSMSVYGFITIFIVTFLIKNLITSLYKKQLSFSLLLICYMLVMNFERSYILSPLEIPLLLFIFIPSLISKLNFSSNTRLN